MWELYIYRYLRESGFELDRRYRNPDFYCTKFGATVCIEAMTVYPTQDEKGQIAKAPTPNDPEEIKEKLMDFIPIKFGSALFSKLKKRYWEIPHIKDKPIVFAIADFHNPFSLYGPIVHYQIIFMVVRTNGHTTRMAISL